MSLRREKWEVWFKFVFGSQGVIIFTNKKLKNSITVTGKYLWFGNKDEVRAILGHIIFEVVNISL